MNRSKTFILRTAGVWLITLGMVQGTCDQGFFTGNDVENCRVYGKIDGELVSWAKAPQACLDAYNIKMTGIDPFAVGCTNPRNPNTFVNSGIRGGVIPNSVLAGLGTSTGDFFEQAQGGGTMLYVLKDSITINGQTISCETSASDCYNAMKTYFASGPGAAEMEDVCTTILNTLARDRELEQSDARNRICQDIKEQGVTPPVDACGTLVDEVQQAINESPNKICAGFAFGTGITIAPGCDGQSTTNTNGIGSGSGSSSQPSRGHFRSAFLAVLVGLVRPFV